MSQMHKNICENFFGLKRKPFGISPQPDFFFGGARREEYLRELVHFAVSGEGIALITAEVGCGKTMLLSMLLREVSKNKGMVIILINNSVEDINALVHSIAFQLDIVDDKDIRINIEKKLIASFAEGMRTLIVIDEGQKFSVDSLEYIRSLSNLETSQGKMLQIIISSQPEIMLTLSNFAMRAFCDRITLHIPMRGLNEVETRHYIDHRLRSAGYRGDSLFDDAAVVEIATQTQGLNRKIHLIAEKAMMAAYINNSKVVNVFHVKQALNEVFDSKKALNNDIYKPLKTKSSNSLFNKISFADLSTNAIVYGGIISLFCIVGILALVNYFTPKSPQQVAQINNTIIPKVPSLTLNKPQEINSQPQLPQSPVIEKTFPVELTKASEKNIDVNNSNPSNSQVLSINNIVELQLSQNLTKYNKQIKWQINQNNIDLPQTKNILDISRVNLANTAENTWFIRLLSQPINNLATIEEVINNVSKVNLPEGNKLVLYRFQNSWRIIIVGFINQTIANSQVRYYQKQFQGIIPTESFYALPINHLYQK